MAILKVALHVQKYKCAIQLVEAVRFSMIQQNAQHVLQDWLP